jgi:DNA-binding GntR family transcriptional regulator
MKTPQRSVTETILHQIDTGDLNPGDLIDEDALIETLDISRTPLREALIKLEAHGLIQRQPRKGAYVFRPTIEEFLGILEIHAGLEGQAAGWAARRLSVENGQALEASVEESVTHSAAKGDADPNGYYQLNLTFHATVVEAAGNPFLTDLVKSNARKLMAYYRARYQYKGTIATSAAEHAHIAQLILDRQSAEAEAAMQTHVNFGQVTAMDLLTALAE